MKNKKKILLVCSKLYPELTGGLHKAAYDLINNFSKLKDFELHVLSEKPSKNWEIDDYYKNTQLHLINEIKKENFFTFFKYQIRFYKKLKSINKSFDVIHFLTLPGGKFFLTTLLARRKTSNLVLTIHDWPMMELKYHRIRSKFFHYLHWILSTVLFNKFDNFVVFSIFNYKILKNKKVKGKIHIVKIGFEQNKIKELETNKYKRKKGQIAYFGSLTKKKGILLLLKSMVLLKNLNRKVFLRVSGTGPLYKKIVKFINSNNLNEITELSGFLSEKEKIRLLHESELAVFPSDYEGYGIAILEALMCGTKVLTSDVGGQVDFKNDFSNIYFFKRRDLNDLVCKINYLLKLKSKIHSKDFNRYQNEKIISDYSKIY